MTTSLDILGIGNAVADVIIHATEEDLTTHRLTKSGMVLVDEATAARTYATIEPITELSGGSAANTITGIALLGAKAGFIGKVRDDPLGKTFRKDMIANGVSFSTPPASKGPPTARCLVFVTPDAERSMQTFLGASIELGVEDITQSGIPSADILYLEAYLWSPETTRSALKKAVQLAKATPCRIALSLSDSGLIEQYRDSLIPLIRDHVDILFANQQEALALAGETSLPKACQYVCRLCDIAIVTRSSQGSLVFGEGQEIEIAPVHLGPVLDATGAGDLYASGFLYGLAQNRSLADCGRMGSLAAGAVVTCYGARPEHSLIDLFSQHGFITRSS